MRLVLLLLSSLALLLALAAGREAKITGLQKLRASSKTELIGFKDSHFKRYVETPIRTYKLLILFHTDPGQQCPPCDKLKEQMIKLAGWYNNSLGTNEQPVLFFVEVTPSTCPQAFQRFQVMQLPFAVVIPEGSDESAGQVAASPFRIQSMDALQQPYQMAKWIEEAAGITITIPQPWYMQPMLHYTVIGIFVLLLLWKLPFLLRNYNHPMVCYLLSLVVVGIVLNGTVWNAIHDPPYWGISWVDSTAHYFMHDLHAQYKIEGFFAVAIHLGLAFLWILLVYAPRIKRGWLAGPTTLILLFCFGYLCVVLWRTFAHRKMGSYPFHFNLPYTEI